MTTKFRHAPEVKAIAEPLIEEHHEHLLGWRIEYLFRNKAGRVNGKLAAGSARIIKGRSAFLARTSSIDVHGETGEVITISAGTDRPIEPTPFFVIEIALDIWGEDIDGERFGLTDAQRVALVDHELCHCQVDEEEFTPWVRPHSIEEFTEIVDRHGLWEPDLERFARSVRGAKTLPFDSAGGDA